MAAELVFKGEAAAEYDRAFAHVTAHFFMFDKQPVGVGVEHQPPAILVATLTALVQRLSQQGHADLRALRQAYHRRRDGATAPPRAEIRWCLN